MVLWLVRLSGFSFVVGVIFCLRVFFGSQLVCCFFLLALASNAAIKMITTNMMAAKYMG